MSTRILGEKAVDDGERVQGYQSELCFYVGGWLPLYGLCFLIG